MLDLRFHCLICPYSSISHYFCLVNLWCWSLHYLLSPPGQVTKLCCRRPWYTGFGPGSMYYHALSSRLCPQVSLSELLSVCHLVAVAFLQLAASSFLPPAVACAQVPLIAAASSAVCGMGYALGCTLSSSCSSQALEHWLSSRGIGAITQTGVTSQTWDWKPRPCDCRCLLTASPGKPSVFNLLYLSPHSSF